MTSTAPSWLHEPPDGPEPKPPVQTREQSLPLEELTWQDFERLILRLVRREGEIVDCFIYGTPGQAQGGIDILATPSENTASRVCYQCKKVTEFRATDIVTAVDKFLTGKWAEIAREFVLCVSISLESTQLQDELDRQRNRLFEKGITLSVWDGATAGGICERLKAHPDLVDDFFGRAWVASFNGQSVATNLGDRLNGYELGQLRARLLSLYSVLFMQHDPGLRSNGEQHLDYRDRYVTADVTERNQIDIISADNPLMSMQMGDDRSLGEMHRPDTAGLSKGNMPTYETRSSIFEWLRHQEKCVVLGEPGYGKSAMLRYLALSILQPERLEFDALEPSYFSYLPVWVSFARFSAAVEQQRSISVEDFFQAWLHQYSFDDVHSLFQRAARGGQVLLLVDGLDEAVAEHSGREALDRIITFLQSFNASVICTSRPSTVRVLGVPPSWPTATLTPLTDEKIEELATRWFDFLEPSNGPLEGLEKNETSLGRRRAQAFLRVARNSPRTLELARNPLLCQSLIQLFRFSHQLPEARITAYKQIVELLLSTHPAARAQAGGNSSPIDSMGLRSVDLSEILIRLAWAMQLQPGGWLTKDRCEEICAEFLVDDTYGLGESRAKARRMAGEVIERLTTHYGILVERAPGEFNLLHLSIQEYLAAESVARMPPDDQLAWMSRVWTSQAWRESLIAWFGILGTRGDKVLSGKASQYLAELGEGGEWRRMQSLELRAEIATADLGLPISEARRIIEQAAREVEMSPFVELRTALARSIALGALGTPVRSECQSVLRRWLPGNSSSKRRQLLEAFKEWKPSDSLRVTLMRALLDEETMCRRNAAEAFSIVFSGAADTFPTLKTLAMHHVQPEVRAAAMHSLGARPEWVEAAAECAEANHGTANTELFLTSLGIRIQQGLQNDEDLNRLWALWSTDSVEFWSRRELVDLLCQGWPQDARLRSSFVERLQKQSTTANIELPLVYLIRCYPGDDEVANLMVSILERFGRHLSLPEEEIWDALCLGFQGHPRITPAVRKMLQEHQEKYERVFWDPQTASAMIVLGDDEARDKLFTSYETADLRSRYWIATALLRGWPRDQLVWSRLQEWAGGDIDMAAPLAKWGKDLIPDVEQRHGWLRKLARETVSTREIGAIVALLRDVPDSETKCLAEGLLDHPRIWYYHRMTLQGLYARAFPNEPRSIEILENSLNEIDGPNPGSCAKSFQNVASFSSRLLAAATPAPIDVRLAVATALRERAVDYETVVAVTPSPFAEENSAVRASCLMARACAARGNPDAVEELTELLMTELGATGSYMDMRRRAALAALLELGCHEHIVSALSSEGRDWTFHLVERFGRDPVSISAVIEHWKALKPLLQQHSLKTDLPIDELVRMGYDALLERDPVLQRELDSYLETQSPDLFSSKYFDTFARRLPKNSLLRSLLVKFVSSNRQGDVACAAARVLATHFSSPQDIWPEIAPRLGSPQEAAGYMADGVIGYLALGWPDGEIAAWADTLPPEEFKQLSVRDRMLFALLRKDELKAEATAVEIVSEPLGSWQYRSEDSHALRIWSESDISESSLARWAVGDNTSLSLTAISLMASTRRNLQPHINSLIDRFNAQLLSLADTPKDGLNAATGHRTSWAVTAYSILRALK